MTYRIWLKVGLAKNNNMKQKKLAHDLGMPESCLSEIINGKRNPNSKQFSAIVNLLGVNPIEVIEWECAEFWKGRKS